MNNHYNKLITIQMKKLFIISICVFSSLFGFSQQIGYLSQFNETNAFWNPAATAPSTIMSYDLFVRQQWLGFSGAPRTMYASVMYPLVDQNMSLGGSIYNDSTGPLSRIGVKLNYAYKLKGILSEDAVLAMGISAAFQQFSFNGSDETFVDQEDGLIASGRESTTVPFVSAGIYYNTHPEDYDRGANSFYFGLAYNQVYASDLLVNESNFELQQHVFFTVGGKIMSYDSYFEPSISTNFVKPDVLDYIFSLKYEKEDAFWTGLGYSSVNDIAVQGGFIIDRFMNNRYAKLKIGALANILITQTGRDLGPGFEMFISYQHDLK